MDTNWTPDITVHDGPKYRKLAEALRVDIDNGTLAVGAKLPPVRDLSWRIGVTPGTVARAYTLLTDEGVLEAAVGRGTYVASCRTPDMDAPIEVDVVRHGSGDSGPLSFYSPGLPNVGQAALIKKLLAKLAQDPPSGLMHYPTRESFRPAREAVVRWLGDTPLGRLNADDIVLSHGGQNGIMLVLQALLRPTRAVIYVEELSYPGFRRAAELLRAKIVSVPMDEHGIVPSALRQAVVQNGPGILCTSPEVHNPTTLFTPEHRRREIATVADRSDLQILEDDCYRLGSAQAATYRMILPERSWYVSSISKTLTPSLRVGFAIAPPGQVAALRRSAEHGFFGLATILSDLAAELLMHPQIDQIANEVHNVFAQNIRMAVNILGRHEVQWRRDVPFLWLTLPRGWRSAPFCIAAEAQGISVRPSEQFTSRDARAPHAVRIAINAQVSPARFEQGIEALRDLLDNPPDDIGV